MGVRPSGSCTMQSSMQLTVQVQEWEPLADDLNVACRFGCQDDPISFLIFVVSTFFVVSEATQLPLYRFFLGAVSPLVALWGFSGCCTGIACVQKRWSLQDTTTH